MSDLPNGSAGNTSIVRPAGVNFVKESIPLVGADRAWKQFGVRGCGMTAAILDSGIYRDHVDFAGKHVIEHNCRVDSVGENFVMESSHGTWVAGILAANGVHRGTAPEAAIVSVKVLSGGNGRLEHIAEGLKWVSDNLKELGVSVVALAYSDHFNHLNFNQVRQRYSTSQERHAVELVRIYVENLYAARIPVVVSAGNSYMGHEGMSYPAILRPAISAGAVYDQEIKPKRDGVFSLMAGHKDSVTHYTQRLHPTSGTGAFTTIFAPGSTVTATGTDGPKSSAPIEAGTSAATPIVAGAILLLQEQHRRLTGMLPSVPKIVRWLRSTATMIVDDCDNCVFNRSEEAFVRTTGKQYPRLQIDAALARMSEEIGNCKQPEYDDD